MGELLIVNGKIESSRGKIWNLSKIEQDRVSTNLSNSIGQGRIFGESGDKNFTPQNNMKSGSIEQTKISLMQFSRKKA